MPLEIAIQAPYIMHAATASDNVRLLIGYQQKNPTVLVRYSQKRHGFPQAGLPNCVVP